MPLSYIDVCTGISAPTMAWKPLGWRALCFAEIEAAPRAVLKHHYPEVPLHGDFTKIEGSEHGPADLVVGGTPCQGFSIAGRRGGLDDERSVLSLEFSRLAYRSRARWFLWENTPGAFSTNGGLDFGAILAEFSGHHGATFEPPRDGWRNSGIVEPAGPDCFGLAWRVLDALHFGVPQRRRRIFVVGYIGNWRAPAAVLFERQSMSGDSPPRRGEGQGATGAVDEPPEGDREYVGAIAESGGKARIGESQQSVNAGHIVPVTANFLTARTRKGINSNMSEGQTLVPHTDATLLGEGFDRGPSGSGDFTLVPHTAPTLAASGAGTERTGNSRTEAEFVVPVTFSAKDRLEEVCEDHTAPLRAGSFSDSHQNGGVMPAVAYAPEYSDTLRSGSGSPAAHGKVNGQDRMTVVSFDPAQITHPENRSNPLEEEAGALAAPGRPVVAKSFTVSENSNGFAWENDHAPTLQTHEGSNQMSAVRTSTMVRRLTPRECERLQGFPDDFTLVPYRKGQMADGPRYKMIGNSQAVPVIRWIGSRIGMVDELLKRG